MLSVMRAALRGALFLMPRRLTRKQFMAKAMPPILFLIPPRDPVFCTFRRRRKRRDHEHIAGRTIKAFEYTPHHHKWFTDQDVEVHPDGTLEVALCGSLDAQSYPGCWVVVDKEDDVHILDPRCFMHNFKERTR